MIDLVAHSRAEIIKFEEKNTHTQLDNGEFTLKK